MSVIYITDHNEVIYDVIKTRQNIIIPPLRYPKRLDVELLKESKKGKKACETMGPAEVFLPGPSNFLKKHSKIVHKKKPKILKNERSPLAPSKETVIVQKSTKDFIKNNIILAKNLKPPEFEPKFVDTRNGTVKKVQNSGLEPKYIFSKKYGKPPSYILQQEANMKRISQQQKDKEELKTLPKCRYVTRQERDQLLNGLKKNWEEMQKEYQLLPMITDTIPKELRKIKLEKELAVLEKDIVLIEKHPFIYVLNED